MDKRQEKAKELYRNKNGFICLWLAAKLHKQINPFFIYYPPSNKLLTQDCSVGAAETAAPP